MLASEWNSIIAAMGVTVRELRMLLGWSQQELADRAVTSQGTISRIENGNHPDVPFHSVVIIARALAGGVTALKVAISPVARSLFNFVQALDPEFTLVEPMNPQLVKLIRAFPHLTSAQRAALADFATATVASELEAVNDCSS